MYKVDDKVVTSRGQEGTIKYIGRVESVGIGYWLGLELTEATGLNNGSLNHELYFKTKQNFGLFVSPSASDNTREKQRHDTPSLPNHTRPLSPLALRHSHPPRTRHHHQHGTP